MGHIFLKFLITYGLLHDATGTVDSASGLAMPRAYYSSVVGFQQLANCECLSLASHPSSRLPRGWEGPLPAARRHWVGRADAQTNDMLIPSRERGVMPAMQDRGLLPGRCLQTWWLPRTGVPLLLPVLALLSQISERLGKA